MPHPSVLQIDAFKLENRERMPVPKYLPIEQMLGTTLGRNLVDSTIVEDLEVRPVLDVEV